MLDGNLQLTSPRASVASLVVFFTRHRSSSYTKTCFSLLDEYHNMVHHLERRQQMQGLDLTSHDTEQSKDL